MLYADFCFAMDMQDAICVAGWTMGAVSAPVLQAGERHLPAAVVLTHMRADLPEGATGFLLRFDLGGTPIAPAETLLTLAGPERTAALPEAGIEALLTQAPDELFICLLLGVSEGLFAFEGDTFQQAAHRRGMAMAESRGFMELPGAAVAQDQALCFDGPPRFLVTGWSGDDGQGPGMRLVAQILDGAGVMAIPLQRDALLRPDLAGAQIRALRVGVTSGFLGAALLPRMPGQDAVCLVGLIHGGMTAGTVRPLRHQQAQEIGNHHDNLRRILVDPRRGLDHLAGILPALPDHRAALGPNPRPPGQGVAVLLEHDLSDWTLRDALRLIRRSEPALTWTGVVADRITEEIFRAALAEREEAGEGAAPVALLSVTPPLADWAPGARHLVVSTSVTLFQLAPFAAFAEARDAGLPALCHVLSDQVEAGPVEVPAATGIAALLAGQAFAAQIDQGQLDPTVPPGEASLGALSQMRWLLLTLARAGRVAFRASPARAFRPGHTPEQAQTRAIELLAMRRAAQEAAP